MAVTTNSSNRKKTQERQKVWAEYKKTDNPVLRQKLLNEYLTLVRNVAGRMAMGFPNYVDVDDLISTGVIGLVEAAKNYDPDRGVKFETFAVPRIRGAILDELRALDWVPRSTRAKSRHYDKANSRLENRLGRAPNAVELAKEMSLSISDFHSQRKEVSTTSILSLDEMICREDDNRQVPRVETVEGVNKTQITDEIEQNELKDYLLDAISCLSEQEKLVVALYYYEELTLKEIGEIMQISESRVSQIHTKAVHRLRGMVKDKFEV
ncbi:MAG: FliA/WhiG family RNA polymerase sigma factor [candidate division Zixibacteria bacterium]|nr:FliA/WhiG family RNA polymerase sigma factor [candidate division Zixibacteria bacterium]